MRFTEKHALIAILLLAAFLRLPNLYDMPFWEFDEGYNLNYAWNLSEGRLLWFSIKYPYVPHPPLFDIILAALIKTFGYVLYPARVFAVALSMGTTVLLYQVGSKLVSKKVGLLSATLYAIYPYAIYWGRMNYNNNLIAFMIMLSLHLYLLNGRWRTLSYAVMGLSVITEFNGVSLVITAFLLARILDRRNTEKKITLLLVPAIIFTAVMLCIMPEYFIFDLSYQFNRFGFTPTLFTLAFLSLAIFHMAADKLPSIYLAVKNFLRKEVSIMFTQYDSFVWANGFMIIMAAAHFYTSRWLFHEFRDGYFLGSFEYYWYALAGLMLIKDPEKRNTALIFSIPILAVTLKIARFDHMCIPLYPLFALGGGVLLPELNAFLRRIASHLIASKKTAAVLTILLLAYPFAYLLYSDVDAFVLGNRIKREDVAGMIAAAEYVNSRITPQDLVLTSSHLSRFVKSGNVSIFIQGVAINGPIEYYTAFPKERFVYNISVDNAKYVILPLNDGLAWLATVENGTHLKTAREVESWGVEQQIGEYYIYRNPDK